MSEEEKIFLAAERNGRDPGAYYLLIASMTFAFHHLGVRRHLSGEELLHWMRRMLEETFGYMGAWLVRFYGLEKAEEVGKAVYELIDAGLFTKREEDSLEDFYGLAGVSEGLEMEFASEEWWRAEGPDWNLLSVSWIETPFPSEPDH